MGTRDYIIQNDIILQSDEGEVTVPPVEAQVPVLEPLEEGAPKAAVLPAATWDDFDLPKKKKKKREVCCVVAPHHPASA